MVSVQPCERCGSVHCRHNALSWVETTALLTLMLASAFLVALVVAKYALLSTSNSVVNSELLNSMCKNAYDATSELDLRRFVLAVCASIECK